MTRATAQPLPESPVEARPAPAQAPDPLAALAAAASALALQQPRLAHQLLALRQRLEATQAAGLGVPAGPEPDDDASPPATGWSGAFEGHLIQGREGGIVEITTRGRCIFRHDPSPLAAQPDEDGDCTVCGLAWPNPVETAEPHECPPGFLGHRADPVARATVDGQDAWQGEAGDYTITGFSDGRALVRRGGRTVFVSPDPHEDRAARNARDAARYRGLMARTGIMRVTSGEVLAFPTPRLWEKQTDTDHRDNHHAAIDAFLATQWVAPEEAPHD